MECSVGNRKRVEWAADALRRKVSVAGVDVMAPTDGEFHGWTLEATLSEVECVRRHVYEVLAEEDLDLQLVQPRGEHYVVIATA